MGFRTISHRMAAVSCSNMGPRQRGYSLIEAMILITLIAILAAIAVAPFNTLVASARQDAEINEMLTFLHLARSEATKQRQKTIICASNDGVSCQDSSQWSRGYLMFVDHDGDRDHSGDETVLRQHRTDTGIQIHTTSGRRTISYQPDGSSTGSNLTITFCDAAGAIPPKAVIVANTGRARVATSLSDGSAPGCG